MEAAHRAPAASAPSRRLPLARILFIVAAGALIALIAAYAARFVSAASFQHERAFRVLEEAGAQLDNLQRTLTHQLSLMSPQMAGRECVAALSASNPDAGMQAKADRCRERQQGYLRRLALKGPRVGLARIDEKLHGRACGESSAAARQYVLTVRAERPGAPFTMFACQAASTTGDTPLGKRLNLIAFTGELTGTVEGFVGQSYFDEVLIALESGAVIASAPFSGAQATQTRTGVERGRRLGVKDARPLLLRAEHPEGEKDEGKGVLPAQPVQFVDKIAGQRYRVFVSVVSPAQETWLDRNGAAEPLRQERIYLIGLKHDDLREQLSASIGPAGRFALTVLVLLALLGWPLAALRAKAPEEPISWLEAIASLIAIVLVPATLAISVVWVWSYQGVLSWTDAAARAYARELADVVHQELERGRDLLVQYRELYGDGANPSASHGEGSPGASAPLRVAKGSAPATAMQAAAAVERCAAELDNTCILAASRDDPYGGWSPFSSVFATNAAGKREGSRYTVYDPPSVSASADYSAREYFLALQQGRGWRASAEDTPYVAQRLFSGGDGSRVLQMAAPRKCANGFCGIVTGSLSVHSLSAAVTPPLLRFAVIDQRTGEVLFHKDDGRSLSENFFVETEHDPELRALVQVGQSDRFAGYYMGGAHRFHHTPVAGAPWSVVTFYSVREAGELSWHAALTALAAYCGVIALILVGSGLGLWIWFKRSRQSVRSFAARFWHRVGSPCSYARWGVALLGGGAVIVLLYEIVTWWNDRQAGVVSPLTWAMCAIVAIAYFVMRRQHVRSSHSACIALWLLLVSAAPAAWIALGFHDAQVRGLLRDALASAGRDVVQRHAAIADDLRRWLSSRDPQSDAFPDPWLLAQPSATMPIAGFTSGACDGSTEENGAWTACVFQRPPLAALIVQRPLDFWRRETWRRAAQDETQQRRIDLLDDAEGTNPSCASAPNVERCTLRTTDGRTLTMRIMLREPEAFAALGDKGRFDATAAAVLKIASLGVLFASIWVLAQFARRRLLGIGARARATSSPSPAKRPTTVFHSRGMTAQAVQELLAGAERGTAELGAVTRINLATQALAELAEKPPAGRVLLTNLDIALTDAGRRPDILRLLERLLDEPDVHVVIHSRTSPLERLYHPERFPESKSDHALSLEESLRWDNVLQKLEAYDLIEPLRARRHPALAVVDHHRVWKLSTRAERLLLYQLATGRLANPRNRAAIDALIARGLVKLDPWPRIADSDFEAFVRTAETTGELAEWQRQAAQASGKRVRTIVITSGLALLLIAVLWFNWTASDQFKIISTLLAASVAFLSQIGQAFSFVRGGSGKS